MLKRKVASELHLSWQTVTRQTQGQGYFLSDSDVDQIRAAGGFVFEVVGGRFHSNQLQDPALAPGSALTLVPEPDNEHDPDAIAVWDAERRVLAGHVPRYWAAAVAAALREGPLHTMSVWEWRENDARVEIRAVALRTEPKVVEDPCGSHACSSWTAESAPDEGNSLVWFLRCPLRSRVGAGRYPLAEASL